MQDDLTSGGREAMLRYGDGDFQVQRHGDYVTCAVTGKKLTLSELRYWSVDRQEAYADAETATKAYMSAIQKGEGF